MNTNELMEFLDSRFHRGYTVFDEDGDMQTRWIIDGVGKLYLFTDNEEGQRVVALLDDNKVYQVYLEYDESTGFSNRKLEKLLMKVKKLELVRDYRKRLYPFQLLLEKWSIGLVGVFKRNN